MVPQHHDHFDTGYDLNIAAVDVQTASLGPGPSSRRRHNTGITITKANPNFVLAVGFISPDKSLSQAFISNYIDVYVKDAIQACSRVGDAVIFGERKYAMRLWPIPAALPPRGLTALDVTSALSEQNVEVAAGQLGQQPSDPNRPSRWPSAWWAVLPTRDSSTTSSSKTAPAPMESFWSRMLGTRRSVPKTTTQT